MRARVLACERAEEVEALAAALFGPGFGDAPDGVLQAMAVAPGPQGSASVLRIGEHSPRSAVDRFVLELARARADAVIVSGEILRLEPRLHYELAREPAFATLARGLAAWRAARGRVQPPTLVVLTRSGALPLDHPVWSSVPRAEVHTGAEGAARLDAALRGGRPRSGLRVRRFEAPGVLASLEMLRAEGAATVSVEAGPRASAPLYPPPPEPPAIDELLRSVYLGPLDHRARGPEAIGEGALAAGFERRGGVGPGDAEADWAFEWWTRVPATV